MKTTRIVFVLLVCFFYQITSAQTDADSLTNHLVHAADYQTAEWGQLEYQVQGTGQQALILLAGAGFDGSLFQEFCAANQDRYTMYLISLPGYGNTKAYPMPPAEESYGNQNWINGVIAGILQLIETQQLRGAALVGHFLIAPHIALRMAAEHPDKLSKVIIVGAPVELKLPPPYDTLGYANRVKFTDLYLSQMWFKTISRETWLNGNFLPETYSLDTLRAKQFWESANAAPLPVQIRYLCENWGSDYTVYQQVKVPVLVLVPSFSHEILVKECNNFLDSWSAEKWEALAALNANIQILPVRHAACNIMFDQPELFNRLVADFLEK
jgi:pimeloyl-ACP methyl ester carboxylesterase